VNRVAALTITLAALAAPWPVMAQVCTTHRGRPPAGPLSALAVASDSGPTLVAVAEGAVVRSDDGGLSWSVVAELDDQEEPTVASIAAAGRRVAVARGSQVLLSDDGGHDFVSAELPLSEPARAIALLGSGSELLVAHGGSVARLAISGAGLFLVDEADLSGDVEGLAASPDQVFVLVGGEVLGSRDGGRSFDRAPWRDRAVAADPARALAVDDGGELWVATAVGLVVSGPAGTPVRRVAFGPGLADPSAIAPGPGGLVYLVDSGDLAMVRIGCGTHGLTPGRFGPRPPRRVGRRVVRGLLPRLVIDLRAGPGRFGFVVGLSWPLLPPDHTATEAWSDAGRDEAAEDRRLIGLRAVAWYASAVDREALAAPAVSADRALFERAVRALQAEQEMALLGAEWP
jgi:hypothetical protein